MKTRVQCVECGNRWELDPTLWTHIVDTVKGRIFLYCGRCKRVTKHLYRSNPKAHVRTSDRHY